MVTRSKKRKLNEMAGGAPVGRQPLTKRKYVPDLQLQQFLEIEINKSHLKEVGRAVKRSEDQEIPFRKSKSRKYHGLIVRKELSQEIQALVIFLRFGSLNSDEREWLSPTEVFKRTGVKLCTQHKLIARWRKRHFLIMKTLREGRKGVLTPEQVQWVTSIDTLQSMVHLSLKKRAMIVRDRFQLERLDAMTLRRYYIKFKVKYIRPNYTYWKSFAEKNSLKEKQLDFVKKLGSIIQEKVYDEIIYIDETTFHLWQKLSRCWVTSGMKLSLIKNRGPSITVIGAISRERGLVHFEVFVENNNANLFMNFI
jgi:transposase